MEDYIGPMLDEAIRKEFNIESRTKQLKIEGKSFHETKFPYDIHHKTFEELNTFVNGFYAGMSAMLSHLSGKLPEC